MLSIKNMSRRLVILLLFTLSVTIVSAYYVPTKRDTKTAPESVTTFIEEPTDMTMLYETANFRYYFRDERDTIAIYDKRMDYTWLTGTDLEYSKDIDDECDDVLDLYEEQLINVSPSIFNVETIINENSVIDGFNGQLRVDLLDLSETSLKNEVGFSLSGITIEQSKHYNLSFAANSGVAKTIEVVLDNEVLETIVLSTDITTYQFDFIMNNPTVNDATLFIHVGTVDDDFTNTTIYFDDFDFSEYDGEDNVELTNQLTRGDFELLQSELTTTKDDLTSACRPKETRLNTTYTGFANSLLSIEYYDVSNNIKRLSSASYDDAESELKMVDNDPSHYRLDIDFNDPDIEVKLHIYFDNEGIRYEVRDEDVTGLEMDVLAAIIISPFLGASGGAYEEFDTEELDYSDDAIFKYKVPGYSLVPDGSGSLIRFEDNDVKMDAYKGEVYGEDPAGSEYHTSSGTDYVPIKQPSMPVFGIAHGNQQAAFVAYATTGSEYMEIISMPEENLTFYNFTYPRFEYNQMYSQVYNKSGDGFKKLYDDRNHFDINIRYDFLVGDGTDSPSADYVGMAKQYRNYLLENDLLHEITFEHENVPIRLDFFMSDVEEGITGFQNMVTTTPSGIDTILSELSNKGITNINGGMLGWNDGGVTLGDPSDTDFTNEIGRKRDFEEIISKYNDLGIDISFDENYFLINEEMMSLRNNAAQHVNSWYLLHETIETPISDFYYARPEKSVAWLSEQIKTFNKLGVSSYTINGITNNLTSDYTSDLLRPDALDLIVNAYKDLDSEMMINNHQPNNYLWAYTDRYLDVPVYGSQFLIETDTVPFLELVLHNTMELYAPYSNFSFYTDADILRMIDYNVFPSFVLTENPAYYLVDTNSNNYYSTEYILYLDLITHVYGNVNEALNAVINAEWENRTVIEEGIIKNTYSNGVEIIINYRSEAIKIDGVIIDAISYEVVGD